MVNAEKSAFAVSKTTKNYRPTHVVGEQEDIMEKTMVENGNKSEGDIEKSEITYLKK